MRGEMGMNIFVFLNHKQWDAQKIAMFYSPNYIFDQSKICVESLCGYCIWEQLSS
jgi:hypothetical protein